MTRLQQRYLNEANKAELKIVEHEGTCMGIGTRDELQGLIDDGILPEGTIIRDPIASDF